MVDKKPGRPTQKRTTRRTLWVPASLGTLIGLAIGSFLVVNNPPPNTDVMKVQASQWYQSMRQTLTLNPAVESPARVTEPKILAQPPVAPPPEANTSDELLDADIAKLLNVNAPMPDSAQLNAQLNDALQHMELVHQLVVTDAATGTRLYDRGGNQQIVPASTLKLYTAVSLLQHLDTEHRFKTTTTYTPEHGITLVGGGDGLLSTNESTNSTIGYAGLADLAEKTWETIHTQLPDTVGTETDIWVDVSRYSQPWEHPTWNDALKSAGRTSPVYPINTYGGFVTNPNNDRTPVQDGAEHAGTAFANHMTRLAQENEHHITFTYAGQRSTPTAAEPVATVHSAPLREQLSYAMKQSNNMLFEMFGRESAIMTNNAPNFAGSTASTIQTLQSMDIPTDDLRINDNSGLSPSSRATLHSTIKLFDQMLADPQTRPLIDTLAIAGYDGTMRYRLTEAPTAGTVHTKTGTLEVASSNAGIIVTPEGRTLLFAINTTGADGDYVAARGEQDYLTEIIATCGCTL